MTTMTVIGLGFALLAGGVAPQPQSKHAPDHPLLNRYRTARQKLLMLQHADRPFADLSRVTEGTYVQERSGRIQLVVIADRPTGPAGDRLAKLNDTLRHLTADTSPITELRGIDYRVLVLPPPAANGWAPASELPRYQNARECLMEYAENQAGSDSDAPLLLLTRGTYVRQDRSHGVKLIVVTRMFDAKAPDYSSVSLQDVMDFFTGPRSPLVGLRGIQYEIRQIP